MMVRNIKKTWKNKLNFYSKREWIKNILYLFIQLLLPIMLTSCQPKPKAFIYMSPSSYENGVSEIEVDKRNYKKVLQSYEEILQQVPEDSIGAADVYSNVGGIYAVFEKDKKRAEEYLNKAIKIHSDKKDELGLAGDYVEMSKKYLHFEEDIEEGLEYLKQAEEIYIKLGLENSFGLAGAMTYKGHLYKKSQRYSEALDEYKKAQDIYQNRNEDNPNLNVFIGQIYVELEKYELAEEEYLKALNINKRQNNLYLIAETQFQLGWLYDCIGDYDNALKQYDKAKEFYEADDYYFLSAGASYNNMSVIYENIGDMDKALEAAINAYKIVTKIKPITSEVQDKIDYCKDNIKWHYRNLNNGSNEGFEKWFENIIR